METGLVQNVTVHAHHMGKGVETTRVLTMILTCNVPALERYTETKLPKFTRPALSQLFQLAIKIAAMRDARKHLTGIE